METTNNITSAQFGIFTIVQDFNRFTVKITRPSKGKYQLGVKNVYYYSFKRKDEAQSVLAMSRFVNQFMTEQELKNAAKEIEKETLSAAKKNFENPYKVGQIFYNSWGYDQTNIDFFQIIEVKSKSVVMQAIGGERTYDQQDSGKVMPVADSFEGKPFTKIVRVRIYNEKVNHTIGYSEFDGRPKYWSSYH